MIDPQAFLELARDLALLDARGRPRQASLRRATSTAYYAVFHFLVREAAGSLIGQHPDLRGAAMRWFTHARMAEACGLFSAPAVQGRLVIPQQLKAIPVSQPLQDVARSFRALQQARHEADYDATSRRFTRQRVRQLVEQAEQLFVDWQNAAVDPWRPTFILFLLTSDAVVRER